MLRLPYVIATPSGVSSVICLSVCDVRAEPILRACTLHVVLNCSAIFLHRLINQVRLRPTWAVFEKKFEGLI